MSNVIERYQQMLARDPKSKVFAALADAYREAGYLDKAEECARRGIKIHPDYASGYVVLGRILIERRQFTESEPLLKKAVSLASDNLLAYQLLGQVYLELKKPKEALKAHKLALFLNPTSQRSRIAVEKLESLTADEYDAELFTMQKISPPMLAGKKSPTPQIERSLSLIDALIVRNELEKAKELLLQLKTTHPENESINKRWLLVTDEEPTTETATHIKPILHRELHINQLKQKKLGAILQALRSYKSI